MVELKPCPFCGGKANFLIKTYMERGVTRGYTFGIYCTKCDITLPKTNYIIEFEMSSDDGKLKVTTDERPQAIEAWNRRIDDGGIH